MRVLFDINIILDVFLDREPFSENASQLVAYAETNQITGLLSANSITTIFYLVTKIHGQELARQIIKKLLLVFEVAQVNRSILQTALEDDFSDYEDAVLYESGLIASVHALVTRNVRDFKHAVIPIYAPQDLLKIIQLQFQ